MKQSSLKWPLVIISIILFILGCVVVCNPFHSDIVITYMLVIGLGVFGVCSIFQYATAEEKHAFDLVTGILDLVVCLMLLSNDALTMEFAMGYILGVVLLVNGIGYFVTAYNVSKNTKLPIAGFVVNGVLAVLLALFFFSAPIFFKVLSTYIFGIFLIVNSIILFISAITMKKEK